MGKKTNTFPRKNFKTIARDSMKDNERALGTWIKHFWVETFSLV